MTLQNRVLPTGDIVASPAYRGTLTGNRGILHDADKKLGARRWTHHAWICCELDFKGRRREPMSQRSWTELFFHDEAVAMSAGHRPCAYCRRSEYTAFLDAWEHGHGHRPSARQLDTQLHAYRIARGRRTQRRHVARLDDLPDGAFILHDDTPCLVLGETLRPFAPSGYGAPRRRPRGGMAQVCTPAPLLPVLRAGFPLRLHPELNRR